MNRGEIWTLLDNGYASKARPVVIVQSDVIGSFDSVILCLLTSYESSTISTRVFIEPNRDNGLKAQSYVMTDKIVTVDKTMLGRCIGLLSKQQMMDVSKQLAVMLGLD